VPWQECSKLDERLRRRQLDVQCPAISTVRAILDRHGWITRRRAPLAVRYEPALGVVDVARDRHRIF
jgi:hypothetical protein